jgi:putative zinc finger/helix-turn-helix YgiT family protein
MSILCINCGKADLRPDTVKLRGEVRSIPYEVEIQGLKCPHCGYGTVDAQGMTEFSRLLSDKYRAEHDLLTSEEIVALRSKLDENQEQFAKRCGIGTATLKRIEKGKIQDVDTNRRILDATRPSIEDTALQFQLCTPEGGYTLVLSGNLEPCQLVLGRGTICSVTTYVPNNISVYGYEVGKANACSSCESDWSVTGTSGTTVSASTQFRRTLHDTTVPVELLGNLYAR